MTSVVIKRGKHGPMATGSTLPGQPQEGQRGNVILEGYFWHEKRKYTLVRIFMSSILKLKKQSEIDYDVILGQQAQKFIFSESV